MLRAFAIKSGLAIKHLTLTGLLMLGVCAHAHAQPKPIVLLSHADSTRAIALESVTLTREPFPVDSLVAWGPDRRTRVTIFALNLELQPGEAPANVTADAEDAAHRHYALRVESVAPVPSQPWLAGITFRLSDDLGDVGDVLVRVSHSGRASNRVRLGIGHLGGGPTDDPGAGPTVVPPYWIGGQVMADGVGVPSASVTLSGFTTGATTTDPQGNYAIQVLEPGDYVLTVAKPFCDFPQPSRTELNVFNQRNGVNFNGIRQKRRVQGQVKNDIGQAYANLEVTLAGGEPYVTRVATTNATGSFIFPEVPIGFGYTITPVSNSIFNFTAQNLPQLLTDTTLSFNAIRRTYSISGTVTDPTGVVAGARVDLSGSGATTLSDAVGNYSFSALPAGFNYTVGISKQDYVFDQSSAGSSLLDSDQRFDFHGTPHVFLSGRVVDETGRGLAGVKLNWNGAQNGSTTTLLDGTYSFLVTAFGNYALTPWKEQDYYTYSPTTLNVNTSGSRVNNFTAVLNAGVSPSYVLEFDGAPKTVDFSMPFPGDFNLFWPDGLDFGHFFWEFWAMPGDNAGGTYMISDGYGGAHAILFGVANFNTSEPGRYQLIGNIWNGNSLTYFESDEGPAPNEWAHLAAGWDGENIVTYFNGVPVGKTAWAGPRITPGGAQGCGRLLIGGSDHSNFIGRIAQVRGFENNNPREGAGNTVLGTFAPQTVFAVDGNLLSYFFRPSENIADLSPLGQYGKQHPGLVRSTANGVLASCNGCPLPQFVLDPTAPDFAHPNNPGNPPEPVDTPAPVPAGALIFDSFSRRNSTYALSGTGGLGATEGGTSGSRTWLTNQATPSQPQPFGILNGRGVLLANGTAVAWTTVPVPVADFDVRVDRHRGIWGGGLNTGISFRVFDSSNYFFAYSSGDGEPSQPQTLTVGYYKAGQRTDLATGIPLPTSWTTLRVVTTADGAIRVYTDGTQRYSTTEVLLAGSPGVGLYNNGPGLALTNRWDNFRVFVAPHP